MKKKTNLLCNFLKAEKGLKQVYDSIPLAKEIKFFATIKDFINFYPEFAEELIAKSKKGELRVKEILTQNFADIAYSKKIFGNPNYEQRFASKGMEFITDNVVFENNVVFFSYTPTIFAVKITSKAISQSINTLFDLAWQSAEKMKL